MKISDQTSISMPMRNLLSIVAAVGKYSISWADTKKHTEKRNPGNNTSLSTTI